ncbi:MAG: hypothetical protein ACKOFY_03605, partial [Candidatus Limnocylindrus sp.]
MKPHNSIRRVLIVSLTIGTLAFTPTNVRAADPIVTVIDGTDMTVVKQTTSGPAESWGNWGSARSDFFQAVVVYVPVTLAAGMHSTISFDYSVTATGGGLKVGGTMACEQASISNNNRQFRVDIVEPWLTGQSWFGSPALGLLKNALTPVANSSGHIDVDVTSWAGTSVNLACRAT